MNTSKSLDRATFKQLADAVKNFLVENGIPELEAGVFAANLVNRQEPVLLAWNKLAIVEAVEELIIGNDEAIQEDTLATDVKHVRNELRAEQRKAIKEWQ